MLLFFLVQVSDRKLIAESIMNHTHGIPLRKHFASLIREARSPEKLELMYVLYFRLRTNSFLVTQRVSGFLVSTGKMVIDAARQYLYHLK